ncbi:hypothetical protein Tco_1060064 [Tanacetum coccineum]
MVMIVSKFEWLLFGSGRSSLWCGGGGIGGEGDDVEEDGDVFGVGDDCDVSGAEDDGDVSGVGDDDGGVVGCELGM